MAPGASDGVDHGASNWRGQQIRDEQTSDPLTAVAPDKSRPVILVGMMGAGKTTVGRRLAARLGRAFIDADKELEDRCGVPVSTVFELEGEQGFRRREALLLDELTRCGSIVLATGGGVVTQPANRALLRERGIVVFLRAGAAELWQRLKRDRTRPLLQTENPRQRIGELVTEREPLYREVAHLTVTSGRAPIDVLVADIISRLSSVAPGEVPGEHTSTIGSNRTAEPWVELRSVPRPESRTEHDSDPNQQAT